MKRNLPVLENGRAKNKPTREILTLLGEWNTPKIKDIFKRIFHCYPTGISKQQMIDKIATWCARNKITSRSEFANKFNEAVPDTSSPKIQPTKRVKPNASELDISEIVDKATEAGVKVATTMMKEQLSQTQKMMEKINKDEKERESKRLEFERERAKNEAKRIRQEKIADRDAQQKINDMHKKSTKAISNLTNTVVKLQNDSQQREEKRVKEQNNREDKRFDAMLQHQREQQETQKRMFNQILTESVPKMMGETMKHLMKEIVQPMMVEIKNSLLPEEQRALPQNPMVPAVENSTPTTNTDYKCNASKDSSTDQIEEITDRDQDLNQSSAPIQPLNSPNIKTDNPEKNDKDI